MVHFMRRLREATTQRGYWERFKLSALGRYITGNQHRSNIYFDHAVQMISSVMRYHHLPADMPIGHVVDLLTRMRASDTQ